MYMHICVYANYTYIYIYMYIYIYTYIYIYIERERDLCIPCCFNIKTCVYTHK